MKCKVEQDRIAHKIATYSLTDGCYVSKYGVGDLYKEAENNLKILLTYDGEFRTEWCDCKHDLLNFRLLFNDERITVQVHAWMDDLYEEGSLIYDALEEFEFAKYLELEDWELDYIKDICSELGYYDETTETTIIKRDSTYEEIIETLNSLADTCSEKLEIIYENVKNTVFDYISHDRPILKGKKFYKNEDCNN